MTQTSNTATTSAYGEELGLAHRCASGDRTAQRQFFHEHKSRVHATLYRILGSNRDMEDLVQESFLQVFRSLSGYRGEASLATWVSRITARVAYAHLSRRRVSTVGLESVPDAPTDDPDAERHLMARQATRRLYDVLDRVDPKHRIAFTLHAIGGHPLREVAEIMEASVVATKSRVWRARKEIARRARRDPILAEYLRGAERAT